MLFRSNLENPDFAKIATVIGMKGYRVTQVSQLDNILTAAFREEGAVLIDVVLDESLGLIPPNYDKGMAQAFSHYVGSSRLPEDGEEVLEFTIEDARNGVDIKNK